MKRITSEIPRARPDTLSGLMPCIDTNLAAPGQIRGHPKDKSWVQRISGARGPQPHQSDSFSACMRLRRAQEIASLRQNSNSSPLEFYSRSAIQRRHLGASHSVGPLTAPSHVKLCPRSSYFRRKAREVERRQGWSRPSGLGTCFLRHHGPLCSGSCSCSCMSTAPKLGQQEQQDGVGKCTRLLFMTVFVKSSWGKQGFPQEPVAWSYHQQEPFSLGCSQTAGCRSASAFQLVTIPGYRTTQDKWPINESTACLMSRGLYFACSNC